MVPAPTDRVASQMPSSATYIVEAPDLGGHRFGSRDEEVREKWADLDAARAVVEALRLPLDVHLSLADEFGNDVPRPAKSE